MTGHGSGNTKTSPMVTLLAGGVSGVIAKSTIAPLERVKILYQVKSKTYSINSVYGLIKNIIKNEGLKGLWKGNTATILRIFPYSAIQWTSYDYLKNNFVTDKKSSIQIFIAGSLGFSTAILLTYPLDVIRARLALSYTPSKNITVGISSANAATPKVLKNGVGSINIENSINFEGYKTKNLFKGLWRGILPTLYGSIPYAGVGYSSFEYFKRIAPDSCRNEKGEIKGMYKLVTGGIAGGLGQTVAYPLDVVRRRIQTTGYGDGKGVDNLKHGTFKTMFSIFQKEGIYALFKGISINYIKVIPTNGVAFLTYETLCDYFNSKLNNKI
ncbi:hypothetical protein RB653_001443 [Dictyostelium firmibasis]|uniref:Uncharacterized protein n=1 Tax=Dictyostelium firmibasis TaxID=79012 RepID=A0AAN7U539_9MYCE